MKVAVIDDGVNEDRYSIGHLSYNVEIEDDLSVHERKGYDRYMESHGTICAGIIKKYAWNAEIASIKILSDKTKKCRPEQLVQALKWCEQEGIRLLNLSAGSSEFLDYYKFQPVVAELLRKGHILVAALSNRRDFSVPACFSGVLGVKSDPALRDGEYLAKDADYDGISFLACGCHYLTDFNGNHVKTSSCNSFATPLITALVCNILVDKPWLTANQVKWELSTNAGSDIKNPFFTNARPDFIDEAIVINLSDKNCSKHYFFKGIKELDLTNFCDLEVKGKNYITILPNSRTDIQSLMPTFVKNQEYISGFLYAGDAPEELKELCRKIGCFLWDESGCKLLLSNLPIVQGDADIPIICIHGLTWPCFKLALGLNRMFINEGYNCKVISDCEKSYLYGIDYIFCVNDTLSLILRLKNKFQLSVIIYCTGNDETGQDYADVHIYFSGKESSFDSERHIITLPHDFTDEFIEKVMNYFELLEDEIDNISEK